MTRHTAMLAFLAVAAALCAIGAIAAPPITLTPGESVTISAQQGGITPPPGPPPLVCVPPAALNPSGTACVTPPPVTDPSVRVLEMNWAAPKRLYTSDYGGFGANDKIAVCFTTGNTPSPSNFLPRIAAAEYQDPPVPRDACLSTIAGSCLNAVSAPIGSGIQRGQSVTMVFGLGNGQEGGLFYPTLHLNTRYCLNMSNVDGQSGNMFIDLVKAGGL